MIKRTVLIPEEALDKHAALLGMTGSGKTSAAKSGIVEPDLEAGRRVIVIDPTGAWWGLRLSRGGKGGGFQVYIFGGDHGDYPLKAANAVLLAEAFATSSDSAIFDTSAMTVSERTTFFTEFAEAFRRKNKGWVRFVIDEAHLFMPQQGAKAGGGVPSMLHAGNNLVSLGRSRGLRIVLISQRAAKLHKDSLTQVHSLIAMQLMSPQDRAAIADWVADQADPTKGKEIIASLPSLAPGEAWVWAPQAKYLERVKFPRPSTFDSSSAPDVEAGEGPTLAPINLDALKVRLATVEAEVKANDPRTLKAQIADLSRRLAAKPAPASAQVRETDDQVLRRPAVKTAINEAAAIAEKRGAAQAHKTLVQRIKAGIGRILSGAAVSAIEEIAGEAPAVPATPVPRPAILSAPSPVAPKRIAAPSAANGHDAGDVSSAEASVLGALLWWGSVGNSQPTRVQVCAICGWRVTSGHIKNVASSLKTKGLVTYPTPGRLQITPRGQAVAPPAPEHDGSIAEFVRKTLEPAQAQVFDELLRQGAAIDRASICAALNWEPTSGHIKNVLGSMKSMEVVEYPAPGFAKLADWIVQ